MIQQIERQFVRTARPAVRRTSSPARIRDFARRAAVRLARAAGTRARQAAPHQPHHGRERLSRARSRAGCCADMSAAARSSARRPTRTGAPFAWRGKIASAALRSSDSTLRDTLRHSSDARLLSLAAGEPAIDCFPTRGVSAGRRSGLDERWHGRLASRSDRGADRAARSDRRTLRRAGRKRARAGRRAAGARSARAVPDRSRRRRHHRSSRLSRRHPVVQRRRRKAHWLGRGRRRHRRARGSARSAIGRS